MEPRNNPPWVDQPSQELDPGLRPAVEAVRKDSVPQDSLNRALKRAEEIPVMTPIRRSWIPRKVWMAVKAAAALLLVATGLWAVLNVWQPLPQQVAKSYQGWTLASKDKAGGGRSVVSATIADVSLFEDIVSPEPAAALAPAPLPALALPRPAPPANLPPQPSGLQGGERQQDEGPQTEAYSHFVDNPFQTVAQNPLSTFATTVDTASYSNVRRFLLQEKRLPPQDAVRVAELINYFPYTYARPKGEHPLAVALDLVECPWNAKHHLLRVALKGREIDPSQLPPRNFVFLIDTSGSMEAPNRLPLLKQSLAMLVDHLTPQDRVALVAYAGSAGLVLPSTPGNQKGKILAALDQLNAGGSTNGGEGIVLAYKVAQENFISNGVNRVILGTDGDFNVGVTSEGELVRLIEEKKKSGVFLSILGYGMGNVKDATMERLSYHGNGHYAYIDSEAEARKVFVHQGASLVAIAKDVKLQIEFNPQRVAGYRLIGYENRMLRAEDFNDDRKHGGSVGAGHTVTALYEIIPAGLPVPGAKVDALKYQKPGQPPDQANRDWLSVKLRYKDPDADSSKLLEVPLTGGVAPLAEASEDVRFASAVAGFGMLLRNSEHRGSLSYAAVRELARQAVGRDPVGLRADFLELIDAAAGLDQAGPR